MRPESDFAFSCSPALQVQTYACPANVSAPAAAYLASAITTSAVSCDSNYNCATAMSDATDAATTQLNAAVACGIAADAGEKMSCMPVNFVNPSLPLQLTKLPIQTPATYPMTTTTQTTPIPRSESAAEPAFDRQANSTSIDSPSTNVTTDSASSSSATSACTLRLGPLRLPLQPAVGIAPALLLELPSGFSPPAVDLTAYGLSLLCSRGSAGPAAGVMLGPVPFPSLPAPVGGTSGAPARVALDGNQDYGADAVVIDGCVSCQPGSFAAESGQTACMKCAPGSYAAGAGATMCGLCGLGAYQPNSGATACIQCAAEVAETLQAGATSPSACYYAEVGVERVWIIGQVSPAVLNNTSNYGRSVPLSIISSEDQVYLNTGYDHRFGATLWLCSPSWDVIEVILKVGFICPFVVIDPII